MKNDISVAIVALAPGARHTQEGADKTERYFNNRIYNPQTSSPASYVRKMTVFSSPFFYHPTSEISGYLKTSAPEPKQAGIHGVIAVRSPSG